jgi:hypothetical protein
VAKLSLEAFAAENPGPKGGRPCWACNIPEAEEINAGRRAGMTLGTILSWLVEKGYQDVTKGKLEAHFINSRHHERGKRG